MTSPTALPADLEAFRRRGRLVQTVAGSLFALSEGHGDGAALLLLHGFPTSCYDFHRVLPLLTAKHRVIAHDHLGFGLSDKPASHSWSLFEQADAALEVWKALGVTRGHLVAHDYGTSVATELVARHVRGLLPIELESVTLCNGSMMFELSRLTPSQKLLKNRVTGPIFAKLASKRLFKAQMRRIFGRPSSVDDAELDAMWAGLVREGGLELLPRISTYQDERVRFRERWLGGLARVGVPVHILWGRRDPVAVAAIAERLAGSIAGATLTWLDDLGHYPMLEAPTRWADAVLGFLETRGCRDKEP